MSSLDASNDVAVIGMAGRFPGAANVAKFWSNLKLGKECIDFLAPEELSAAGVDPSLFGRENFVRAASRLRDIDLFDAEFFGYSPKDAAFIDPQQRVFLECAWEALEDAAYDPARYRGLIGVYASAAFNTYLREIFERAGASLQPSDYLTLTIGNDKDYLATRVSYKLGLRGPSIGVQTACSSSLVAVHVARQALLNFECDIALAGGVAIHCPPRSGYLYQKGELLSPDGHCRTFDAKAQGTVFGDGAGLVVLKRLDEALADGDRVMAVLRGSAINNDGDNKVGYTAPSPDGQAAVIAAAQLDAGVHPDEVQYIEAHGTGTPIGDPIEIAALTRAFRTATSRTGYCRIGSVKTNIGHLDVAAGVTGLIKCISAVQDGCLPPSLNFEQPNPELALEDSPFVVCRESEAWPNPEAPLVAGVSSFGVGGTNAHVVLQEAPRLPAREAADSRALHVLTLSAKTPAALDQVTTELCDHLASNSAVDLGDVALTLQVGRQEFDCRRSIVCRSVSEAISGLRQAPSSPLLKAGAPPSAALIFAHEDEIETSYGAELYRLSSPYRRHHDDCLAAAGWAPSGPEAVFDERRLQAFASQYASAMVLVELGLRLTVAAGSGVGELLALVVSGQVPLSDAIALLVHGRPVPSEALTPTPISAIQYRTGRPIDPTVTLDVRRWQRSSEKGVADAEASAMPSLPFDAPVVVRIGEHSDDAVMVVCKALAAAWEHGAKVAWDRLYHRPQRRLSLPTYPFQRRRHWIEGAAADRSAASAKRGDMATWFYAPAWSTAPGAASEPVRSLDGPTLLFAHDEPPHRALADALRRCGAEVITVRPGSSFTRRANGDYDLNASRSDDFHSLSADLSARGIQPERIIYAWLLTPPAEFPSAKSDTSRVEEFKQFGLYSLVYLARSVNRGLTSVCLEILTNEVFEVSGEESVNPLKALALGPCRVIPEELPHVRCRLLDMVWPEGCEIDAFTAAALDEIGRSSDATVALRRGRRWSQEFRPVKIPDGPMREPLSDGVCLITGGLGGIGLTLAKCFAASGQTLALVNRTPLPPRETWSAVAADPADPNGERIRALQSLEEAGGRLVTLAADIADERQLRSAVKQIRDKFGAVTSLIHAAGLPGRGLVENRQVGDMEEVLRPKVDGLLSLARVLQKEPLEKVFLMSSLLSSLGVVGQVDYTSANAFLDAVADKNQLFPSARVVSIQWDAWREVGMAANAVTPKWLKAAHDREMEVAITPQEGKAVFERLRDCELTRVLISPRDFIERQHRHQERRDAQAVSKRQRQSSRAAHPRPEGLANEYVKPRNHLEKWMAELWEELLGVHPVGVTDSFFDLGGHSLLASSLIGQIRDSLDLEVSLETFLVNEPTVAGLLEAIGVELIAAAGEGEAALAALEGLTDEEVERQLSAEVEALRRGRNKPAPEPRFTPGPTPDRIAVPHLRPFWQALTAGEGDADSANRIGLLRYIEGDFDLAALESAVQLVAERHDILRGYFSESEGTLWLSIKPKCDLKIDFHDLENQTDIQLADLLMDLRWSPVDHEKTPVRLFVIKISPIAHILGMIVSHLMADDISVVQEELAQIYNAQVNGHPHALPEKPLQYADYCRGIEEWMQTEAADKACLYWRSQLRDLDASVIPEDVVPADTPPAVRSLDFYIDALKSRQLQKFAEQHGVTLPIAMLAIQAVVLADLTKKPEASLSLVVSDRHVPALNGMVGLLVKQMCHRIRCERSMTLLELLDATRANRLQVLEHQWVPQHLMAELRGAGESAAISPYFNFRMDRRTSLPAESDYELGRSMLQPTPPMLTSPAGSYRLFMAAGDEGIIGNLTYSTGRYLESTMMRFVQEFQFVLNVLLLHPDWTVGRVIEEFSQGVNDHALGESGLVLLPAR